jgi:hypothetical protein
MWGGFERTIEAAWKSSKFKIQGSKSRVSADITFSGFWSEPKAHERLSRKVFM